MFKRKRNKNAKVFEEGFLSGISFVLIILETQQKLYGDIASIEDMKNLIAKDL